MSLTGEHILGHERSGRAAPSFTGFDPRTGEALEPAFREATLDEVNTACVLASEAAAGLRALEPSRRAAFLRRIADEIEGLGDALLQRAERETALPPARLQGERGRTVAQLRMFAGVVEDGSWVGARIDHALPERQPLPKPDLRRMLIPLGPIAVFGASNFPLAFSVAGGDTASALAAGCPVVCKAHPMHPGTSELVGLAIQKAARELDLPPGTFSLVHGTSHEVGRALVEHPAVRAIAFTGSLRGGRALFDLASRRADPIPVYAEMGSTNPMFCLPDALATRAESIAEGWVQSVNLGVGQFCTNPGLAVFVGDEAADRMLARAEELMRAQPAGTLVHAAIRSGYEGALQEVRAVSGTTELASGAAGAPHAGACSTLFVVDGETYRANERLGHEVYGPASIGVRCASRDELLTIARSLHGHLTATIHATDADLTAFPELADVLATKAGRVVWNGFPTGVEVCPSMQHGGPYPATTDARSTSVGTAAIERFARPVAFQNAPPATLPPELRDENPRNVWRLVDGEFTR